RPSATCTPPCGSTAPGGPAPGSPSPRARSPTCSRPGAGPPTGSGSPGCGPRPAGWPSAWASAPEPRPRPGRRYRDGVDERTMRARVAAARVGTLATVTRDGRPHVVPCCFAVDDDTVWSAVDAKPKSTLALRRLENVRANPAASLLVDHYEDDWTRLWWVR